MVGFRPSIHTVTIHIRLKDSQCLSHGSLRHLVALDADICGEKPPPGATPAELVAAIRRVWEALERLN